MTPPLSPNVPENPQPTRRTLEQAAEWFVLLASGEASSEDRYRWHAWRMAHPSHEAAWQRAEGSAARFANIPPDQAPASLAALSPPSGLKSHRRKTTAKLAALLIACFIGWQSYRASDWSADQITAVGEQRGTMLADGSNLLLDTDSAVDVEFSEENRLVRLRRGQIMIATVPDPTTKHRPFLVETADGRVLALGTRFTVQQEEENTRVTVIEARVALQGKVAPADSPILPEGQTARFDRHGLLDQRTASSSDTAWSQGLLIANDMRLADLIAQLARYRQGPLTCAPVAGELRISGTFPVDNIDRVLAALGSTLPIRIERRTQVGGKTSLVILPK